MASKNTSSNSRQAVQRSNSDSARWIAGLLLLFIGLFAAAAVFFSFFSWAADQSGLQKSVEERAVVIMDDGLSVGIHGEVGFRLLEVYGGRLQLFGGDAVARQQVDA